MKNLFYKIGIVATFIFSFQNSVNAQNFKEDILKVTEKFQNANFKMEVQMKEIHWNNVTQPIVVKGEVKRKGDNYFTDFADQINMINDKFQLVVYKNEKKIIYLKIKDYKKEELTNNSQMLPDEKMFNKDVKLISNNESGKEYEISNPMPGIAKMKLKITKDNVLQEVKYRYEKMEGNPVKEVVITYSKVVFNPTFSSTDFSESIYFKIVNNQPVPTLKYKDYALINAN